MLLELEEAEKERKNCEAERAELGSVVVQDDKGHACRQCVFSQEDIHSVT